MKRYLVLGGNGFIGRNIVKKLGINNEVIIADRGFEDIYNNKNISFKKIDFVSHSDFSDVLDGIDTVIHLISTIGPNENINNIEKDIMENVFPTVNLLDSMVKCNTKKIIFISSGGTIYGEHEEKPICENEIKQPICHYGVLKDLIEKYLDLYKLYYNIDYRVIRLANPYSDVAKSEKSQGIIPIFVDLFLSNQEIKIWGDGNDVRDYIYIDDAINAIMKIINYKGNEKIFNVGTGKGHTVNQVLKLISNELKINPNVTYVNERKCDVKYNVLNIDKISSILKWEPKVNLEDGIKKIVRKKVKGECYEKRYK